MKEKYNIGVAFSGGGARGAAHCGALQAFHEYGIKPEVVSGSSVGSLVATLYACGFEPRKMIELFQGLNFFKDIVSPTVPTGGLFDSRPLVEMIRKTLPYTRLEDLPVPTYVVAADLEHAVPKVFSKGEIAPRVVASCSIPVVFRPMNINGIHYVDGGAFQNLPVAAIRNKCKTVIALSLINLDEEKYKDNVIAVASRSFQMMMVSNNAADKEMADIVVDLDTSGCTAYDMSKIEDLFFRGYESTVKVLEENGYQRVLPKENIVFPPRKNQLEELKNYELVVREKVEKGLTALKSLKKSA